MSSHFSGTFTKYSAKSQTVFAPWQPLACLLYFPLSSSIPLFHFKAMPIACPPPPLLLPLLKLDFRQVVAVKAEKNIMLYQVQMWNCENEIDEEIMVDVLLQARYLWVFLYFPLYLQR